MATSTRASASSAANISPVGPPPEITTACSVMVQDGAGACGPASEFDGAVAEDPDTLEEGVEDHGAGDREQDPGPEVLGVRDGLVARIVDLLRLGIAHAAGDHGGVAERGVIRLGVEE